MSTTLKPSIAPMFDPGGPLAELPALIGSLVDDPQPLRWQIERPDWINVHHGGEIILSIWFHEADQLISVFSRNTERILGLIPFADAHKVQVVALNHLRSVVSATSND